MLTEQLCRSLLTADHHDWVAANRKMLEWAAEKVAEMSDDGLSDDELCGDLLVWILEYDRKYGKCPDEAGIVSYVRLLKSKNPEEKQRTNDDVLAEQLAAMHRYFENETNHDTDPRPLTDALFDSARRLFVASIMRMTASIAMGKVDEKTGEPYTLEQAFAWQRKQLLNDFKEVAPRPPARSTREPTGCSPTWTGWRMATQATL